MKLNVLMTLLVSLAFGGIAIIVSCGGDDDDSGDDDTGTDPDVDKCKTYTEEFFGSDGCFDDSVYYDAMNTSCDEIATVNAQHVQDAWDCLDGLNCADYGEEEAVNLWADVSACLAPLLQ